MKELRKILFDILMLVAVLAVIIFWYQNYGEQTMVYLFGEPQETIYVDQVAMIVTYADKPAERKQGLAGVQSLGETEGKLFIFDTTGDYGMWMKDMLIPIDIFWIDEDLRIVHIEENVTPDTYPAIYHSPVPARFVLETNAFFADTLKIHVGDKLTIPAADLPADIKSRLQ